jgi:hypothetical protein
MTVAVLSLKRGILTAFPVEESGSILRILVQPYDILASACLEAGQALDNAALVSLMRGSRVTWHLLSMTETGEVTGAGFMLNEEANRGSNSSFESKWSGAVGKLDPTSDAVEHVHHPMKDVEDDIPTKERDMQRFWNCEYEYALSCLPCCSTAWRVSALTTRAQAERGRPLRTDEMRRLVMDQEELYGMGILTG